METARIAIGQKLQTFSRLCATRKALVFLVIASMLSSGLLLHAAVRLPLSVPSKAKTFLNTLPTLYRITANGHTEALTVTERSFPFYLMNDPNFATSNLKPKRRKKARRKKYSSIAKLINESIASVEKTQLLTDLNSNKRTFEPIKANSTHSNHTGKPNITLYSPHHEAVVIAERSRQSIKIIDTNTNFEELTNKTTTVQRQRNVQPNRCNVFLNTPNKSIPVVVRRPPWFDLTANATSDATNVQRVFYLTVVNVGQLGNQMFEYASLFGIAWRNSRIPLWNNDPWGLRYIFGQLRIDADHQSQYRNMSFHELHESHWLNYINATERLPPTNILLNGYLQNKRYFAHVENQLRHEFTFSTDVMRQAQRKLDAFNASSLRENGYVRVVIHVRRGDYRQLTDRLLNGQPEFFNRSMAYFADCQPKVHFIVISDDVSWCRKNIKSLGSRVDFIDGPPQSPVVDLAIASLCDHAIITVGTFSWWAAWFANGVTLELGPHPAQAMRPAMK